MSKREMLINYVPGEECRIAITEDGRLEELYQERASAESHVGNIYKGRVLNVEPSIQAAFIDFGLERNGFLHISDLHPKYFTGDAHEETEQVGLKTPRRDRPPIQRCLRRGQSIFVQVLKEGIGTKGPTLTSYLSIPGRFLVMMPDMERVGVSRKLEDDEARRRLRDVIAKLKPPPGFGVIGRTAASEQSEADLKRDMAYLKRVWKQIDKRGKEVTVGELFAESDLVIRTIRDVYSSDIDHIIVDDLTAARRARDFLAISNPRTAANVMVYRDPIPLFHRFDLERQIETINARTVPLPSGGSLVIDSTEALVAIDVNSGKNRDNRDAEMTAYKTNLEAVDEISRQLRLRDLGGVIVNDLIDMRNLKHRRDIESRFKDNLKRDRARTRTGPISQFGTLEMTRQRMRPSLKKSIYTECASCLGQGEVKSAESVVLDVMRRLQLIMQREPIARLELTVSPDVAFQLLNRRRQQLVMLEKASGKPVLVRVNPGGPMDFLSLAGFDGRGGAVDVEAPIALGEPRLEPVESAVPDEPLEDELDEVAEEEQASAPAPHRMDHGRGAAPARDEDEREEPASGQSGNDDIEPSEESVDDGAAKDADDESDRSIEENEFDGDEGGDDRAPVKSVGASGGRVPGNAPGVAPGAGAGTGGGEGDDAAGRKRRRGRRGGRRHRARRERQREREAMEGKQGPATGPGAEAAPEAPMADAARGSRDADRPGIPTTSADESHSGLSDADHRADADDGDGEDVQSTPRATDYPINADGSDADETVEPSETADPEDHRPPMLDEAGDEQDIPDDIGNRRDNADDAEGRGATPRVSGRGDAHRPSNTPSRQGPQDGPAGQGGDGKPRRRRRRGGRGRRGKGGGGDGGGQGSSDQSRQSQGQRPPALPHQGQAPHPPHSQPPRHPQGQRPPQPQQPNTPRPQQPRRHDQPRPSENLGGQDGRSGNFGDAGSRPPATPPIPPARPAPVPPPIRHETPVPPPPPVPPVPPAPVPPVPAVTPPPASSPTTNAAGPSRGYRGFRKLRDNTGGSGGVPGTSSNDGN